ncbi:MAG: hypothetical protein ACREAY_06200 [Nitrososphaera sp.]|uniref:hypothetical protein n=1 Tax=Nitrososphaera sp. TaxID=1971748 RepID=UPI003D6EC961
MMRRRGISTVVGAVFMVIIMAGALNVTLWMTQQQDRIATAVTEKSGADLDRLNEKIDIADIRVDGSRLNMTIANTGGQPAQLASIYIVNETASPKQQFRYDLDVAVDGRNSIKNIGQALPFTATSTSLYSVKIVTKSGNTAVANIAPLSTMALPMSLYVIPPTVTPGENMTLLYTVTNNSTDAYLGNGVTPALSHSLGCTAGPGCQLTQYAAPAGNTKVAKGATSMFKWAFKVDAPDNTPVTFNATLVGARAGNYAIEKGRVEIIDLAQQSAFSEIIVSGTLVQRPGIFLTVPAPFGDSQNDQGLWGITIVNPTNTQMEVSRLVISAFSPKVTSGHRIFASPCPVSAIYPSTSSEWKCDAANQLEWKDVATPEVVDALSSKSFLARMEPGDLVSNDDEPAFMVSATVFTSLGQFASTGYSSSMQDGDGPVANIYLTDTTDPPTALQNGHMFAHKNNIADGIPVTIYVSLADLDTVSSNYIKSGGKLVINVPKGFTGVALGSFAGFSATPAITPYPDGSTQIVATLAEHLGDTSVAEAKILSFTATAPVVPDKRIFIMHALLDGETNTNFSAGAFSQIALQVIP